MRRREFITLAAFVQRLHELGWIEGRTIAIEYRWAEGREERYAAIAEEFVSLKVEIIVTSGAAVIAAKQATSVIPIVFGVANDPTVTSFHHQPDAQHPKSSSAIHKLPADYPIFRGH